MKKLIYIFIFMLISFSCANAHVFELYNPQTKETTDAMMMSIDTGKNNHTYYIGLYDYNIYCVIGKNIKTNKKNYKSGVCYPLNFSTNTIERNVKLPKWKEMMQGTYDDERAQIKQEFVGEQEVELDF